MFLSPAEVAELTGWKTWKKQVVALNSMDFTFKIQPVGRPIVLRAHVEERMGLQGSSTAQDPRFEVGPNRDAFKPDFEALARSEKEAAERKAARKADGDKRRAEKEARRQAREKAQQDKLQPPPAKA